MKRNKAQRHCGSLNPFCAALQLWYCSQGGSSMSVGSELLAQAQAAPEEVPRSKLENYCAAIFELRRKRWSYEKIAHWLKERGVEAVPSSIFRFCRSRQGIARPPAPAAPPQPPPAQPAQTSPTETKPKRKYHFNLDI
jgi:hypothetical protein